MKQNQWDIRANRERVEELDAEVRELSDRLRRKKQTITMNIDSLDENAKKQFENMIASLKLEMALFKKRVTSHINVKTLKEFQANESTMSEGKKAA